MGSLAMIMSAWVHSTWQWQEDHSKLLLPVIVGSVRCFVSTKSSKGTQSLKEKSLPGIGSAMTRAHKLPKIRPVKSRCMAASRLSCLVSSIRF